MADYAGGGMGSSAPGVAGYGNEISGYNSAVQKKLNAKNELAEQRDKDWKTLTTNPAALGMSDAERTKLIGEATGQANAAQNAQVSQMNSAALAGQGFQAGTFAQGARDVASQSSDAAAKASVGINQLNQQLINQEKQRIFSEMDAERQRQLENANFWRGVGIDAVSGLIGFAAGGPLGAAAASVATSGAGGLGGGAGVAGATDPAAAAGAGAANGVAKQLGMY